ncbi:MAG: neutral/alkaline non-lysosomal ceramidase N-terminal domain-containing protein [Acidobacteriota bacterium]
MKRIAVLTLLITIAIPSLWAEDLKVGRAAVKITPPVGSVMGNSYGIKVSKGIHDDLFAKALVLEANGNKAALVACDLISIRGAIISEARRLIEEQTDLRGDQVIISATHAHAGPQMHPLFLKAVGGEPEKLSLEYIRELPKLIAKSIQLAEADLSPARASVGRVYEDSIISNRRFLMADGTVEMNPGRNNSDVIRPVGPVDPQVSVLYFESLDGEPLATLVNYSLHVAIVGGDEFSADYPAVLSRLLKQIKGEDMLTIFTNGTSGNVNNSYSDLSQGDPLRGHAEAARVGTILAASVLKAYAHLQPVEPAPLHVRADKVQLPISAVTAQEAEWAHDIMAGNGQPNGPKFTDVVRAWRIIDLASLNGGPLVSEVQAITLGNQVALVGFPGDAFVELGLSIKTNSPFPFTIVSEQSANGAISYVPNRKAFPEGDYEVISARFEPGGAELLVEAAVRLLTDLFPYHEAASTP